MTIWFSTNIPEMRAISTFNRVSTDIAEIQQRVTTGQRINSGRDDPGGLIIREGLRADIKGIHSTQANMKQAEIMMDTAASGMTQLLELIRGSDVNNPSEGSLLGILNGSLGFTEMNAAAENFMTLFDSVIAATTYNNVDLLKGTARTFQLGGGQSLAVTIGNLDTGTEAAALRSAVTAIADDTTVAAAIGAAVALQTKIAEELGVLGGSQQVVAMNQRLLDSRLTSVVAAEGRISNADIAVESSRMARAELLAQNAMSSIMYTRNFAAFSVTSLFR